MLKAHHSRIPWDFGPTDQGKAWPQLLESIWAGGTEWCLMGYPAFLQPATLGLVQVQKLGQVSQCSPVTWTTGVHEPPLPIAFFSSMHNWADTQCSLQGKDEGPSFLVLSFYSRHFTDKWKMHSWMTSNWDGCNHCHPSPFKIIPAVLELSYERRLWITQEHVVCSCKLDV